MSTDERSRGSWTQWRRAFRSKLARPLFPLLVRLAPSVATTSARLGRAVVRIVQGRADRYILESADINRLGR